MNVLQRKLEVNTKQEMFLWLLHKTLLSSPFNIRIVSVKKETESNDI